MSSKPLRLGTRGSPLARWQAQWVAGALQEHGTAVELVPIATSGDVQQTGSIGAIGTFGVFTKEIQRALLDGHVDIAVHSLKDLPTEPVAGLSLSCVPPREETGDALISRRGARFEDLPTGCRVGTGSFRRRAQLLHARDDLVIRDIRGNVETRLKKLDQGEFDAIILAVAGLRRLEMADRITQVLPKSLVLPAVGQGALGIETRAGDARTIQALAPLGDTPTYQAVTAERKLLFTLRGGCLAPVGAWGRMENARLRLSAVVLSRDGERRLHVEDDAPGEQAADLGERLAEQLLAQGAAELIAASRDENAD